MKTIYDVNYLDSMCNSLMLYYKLQLLKKTAISFKATFCQDDSATSS